MNHVKNSLGGRWGQTALLMALALLAALPSQADDKVSLPFSLCGKARYSAGNDTTIVFQDREEQAYELKGIAKEGHIYFIPDGSKLLLVSATISYGGLGALIDCSTAQRVVIQVRGHNTIESGAVFVRASGSVTIEGETDRQSSVNVRSSSAAIQLGGHLTLSRLSFTNTGAKYGVRQTRKKEKEALLTVNAATVSLSGTKCCMENVLNVVTEDCGLSKDLKDDIAYDKARRRLMREGKECRTLNIVTEAYVVMDTRDTADDEQWEGRNAEGVNTMQKPQTDEEEYTEGENSNGENDDEENTEDDDNDNE